MAPGLTPRRYAGPGDLAGIARLVSAVVRECYGHLLTQYRFDPDENWPAAWLVEDQGRVIAVMMSEKDWVEDLWIAAAHRRNGLGRQLLEIAEQEIAARGFAVGRLRLVAENHRALAFYLRQGWTEDRRYPHEVQGFEMVEMTKPLTTAPARA